MKKLFLVSLLGFLFLGFVPSGAGNLVIKVSNLKNNSGNVGIIVHTSTSGFDNGKSGGYRKLTGTIANKSSTIVVKDLPFGRYAILALHDANLNGDMDLNFMGIPTEGYGVSNNAYTMFGPKSFEEAAFSFQKSEQVHVMAMSN